MAESFNNFFTNIGPNTEITIPRNPAVKPEKYLRNRNQFIFLIAHTSIQEVLDIITNYNQNLQVLKASLLSSLKSFLI